MSFRLSTLLYLFALTAATLTVFGVAAVVVLPLSLAVPAIVRELRRGNREGSLNGAGCLVVVALAIVALWFLVPQVHSAREAARRSAAIGYMMQLNLSLLNYESVHGHLPPPVVTDDEGNPLYSWRVAILPFIEGDALYKKLHLNEPWDSPHNKKLLDVNFEQYVSPHVLTPRGATGYTNYVAIVGPETVWQPGTVTKLSEIRDGTSNTILLLEIADCSIHWAEPRDISIDEAVDLLTGEHSSRFQFIRPGYFTSERLAMNISIAGFADGHVEPIGPLANPGDARALLTRAGDETIGASLDTRDPPGGYVQHLETIIHWPRIWGVAVWLALALLPLHPTAQRRIWPPKTDARDTQEDCELPEHEFPLNGTTPY